VFGAGYAKRGLDGPTNKLIHAGKITAKAALLKVDEYSVD